MKPSIFISFLILLTLSAVSASIFEQIPAKIYDDYSLIKITSKDVSGRKIPSFLKQLNEENSEKFELWNDFMNNGSILAHVSSFNSNLLDEIESKGFHVKVVSSNMSQLIGAQMNSSDESPSKSLVSGIGANTLYQATLKADAFYKKYHTLSEINAHIYSLEKKFPEIVSVSTIGSSWRRNEINLVSLVKNPSNKIVFFECGIHAREWISPAACLYMIQDILINESHLLDKWSFQFVPNANPDGYQLTWTVNRMWRKNVRPHIFGSRFRARCFGVDLNRNLDAAFGTIGSSKDPCSDSYQGPDAFSEPETRTLRDHIMKMNGGSGLQSYEKENGQQSTTGQIFVYFTFHSYSQLWMYPYGYGGKPAYNAEQLKSLSKKATDAIKASYGKEYRFGDIETVIYPTSGDTIDWIHEKTNIKLAFAVELRDTGDEGFLLNPKWIEPTAVEVWNGVKTVLDNV